MGLSITGINSISGLSSMLAGDGGGTAPVYNSSFDGGANTASSTTSFNWSWTHTSTGIGTKGVIVFVTAYNSTSGVMGSGNASATVGGASMTLLGFDATTTNCGTWMFGKTGVATGGQTVSVTVTASSSSTYYPNGASIAFDGVTSFGTAQTTNTTGGTISISYTGATSTQPIVCGFSGHGSPSTLSSYSQTERVNTTGTSRNAISLGDAAGSDPVAFSVSRSGAVGGEGIAVKLIR